VLVPAVAEALALKRMGRAELAELLAIVPEEYRLPVELIALPGPLSLRILRELEWEATYDDAHAALPAGGRRASRAGAVEAAASEADGASASAG
jgi:hypothetical protein